MHTPRKKLYVRYRYNSVDLTNEAYTAISAHLDDHREIRQWQGEIKDSSIHFTIWLKQGCPHELLKTLKQFSFKTPGFVGYMQRMK